VLGAHSIVWFSAPSLTIVTVNAREVFGLVAAELGAIGANPWAETASRVSEMTLVNMIVWKVVLLGWYWRFMRDRGSG